MKNSFVNKIYRYKTINDIEIKLKLLGSRYNYQVNNLLAYRVLVCLVLLIPLVVLLPYGFITGLIIVFFVYYLLGYLFLDYRILLRKRKLEHEALYFFEVLSLTLSSSQNFKNALEMAIKTVDNELSYEFKESLEEMKIGKSFTEAMEDMQRRIPSSFINSILVNVIESNKYGNNISDSLKQQIIYLQEKEVQDIKGYIAKLPIKISVISVIFFIPIILLIVLSPVIIRLIIG